MNSSYNIGLSCEAKFDINILKSLIERILVGYRLNFIHEFRSDTSIFENIKPHLDIFFNSDPVDIGVFFTDCDEEKRRYNRIKNKIYSLSHRYFNKNVVGVPNPNIEAWLLRDQSTVKRIFNLDGSKPLLNKSLLKDPKSAFHKLCSEYQGDLTVYQISEKIIRDMNINVMCSKDASFNRFYNDLLQIVK